MDGQQTATPQGEQTEQPTSPQVRLSQERAAKLPEKYRSQDGYIDGDSMAQDFFQERQGREQAEKRIKELEQSNLQQQQQWQQWQQQQATQAQQYQRDPRTEIAEMFDVDPEKAEQIVRFTHDIASRTAAQADYRAAQTAQEVQQLKTQMLLDRQLSGVPQDRQQEAMEYIRQKNITDPELVGLVVEKYRQKAATPTVSAGGYSMDNYAENTQVEAGAGPTNPADMRKAPPSTTEKQIAADLGLPENYAEEMKKDPRFHGKLGGKTMSLGNVNTPGVKTALNFEGETCDDNQLLARQDKIGYWETQGYRLVTREEMPKFKPYVTHLSHDEKYCRVGDLFLMVINPTKREALKKRTQAEAAYQMAATQGEGAFEEAARGLGVQTSSNVRIENQVLKKPT